MRHTERKRKKKRNYLQGKSDNLHRNQIKRKKGEEPLN